MAYNNTWYMSTSTSDVSLIFHRFPLPSKRDGNLRARVWAIYCFPNEEWTTIKLQSLHTQHKMLCSKHFDHTSYISSEKKKLNKFSIPVDAKDILIQLRRDKKPVAPKVAITEDIDGFQDHAGQGRTAEIATQALTFMAIGVRKHWKQPVAFYFSGAHMSSDRLAVLIKEVLTACFGAGLKVVGMVCDCDGANIHAINILGSSSEHYFIHEGTAKYNHIQEFYKQDKQNPIFVFAPALIEQHIQPNGKQKMKVRLAAQVLSHTVAAGLFAKISQNELLPQEAIATGGVIANMDKLFDAMNEKKNS